jgi:hypothetical protein
MYEQDEEEIEQEDEDMKGKKGIVIFVPDHIIHSFVPQMC